MEHQYDYNYLRPPRSVLNIKYSGKKPYIFVMVLTSLQKKRDILNMVRERSLSEKYSTV